MTQKEYTQLLYEIEKKIDEFKLDDAMMALK